MGQSLAKIYTHVIFSTKSRFPFLTEDTVRSEMQAYLGGTCNVLGCPVIAVGGVEDHVHILFVLSKNRSIADFMGDVKTASSKWVKRKGERYRNFAWQNGYGAFSVSQSQVETVRRYVAAQEQHHLKKTFQEEFREILRKYEIEFDERYIWD